MANDYEINITITESQPITITLTGINLSYVNADSLVRLDGAAGNTYLKYNSVTSKVELWVDGVKKASWG